MGVLQLGACRTGLRKGFHLTCVSTHKHRRGAYLIGWNRTVADIPFEYPSCFKQHATNQCQCVCHASYAATRVHPGIMKETAQNDKTADNAVAGTGYREAKKAKKVQQRMD